MALYMISFASRGIIFAFFAAVFPQLARNTPHSRELRKRHDRGELSVQAYEKEKSIEKSKISSVSMVRLQICILSSMTRFDRFAYFLAMLLHCYSICHY